MARQPSAASLKVLELVYQPMLELLAYPRSNGFKILIVSGGVEFMRAFAEQIYGILPEQVIGSSGVTKFQMGPDGKPVLMREPEVALVDDGPGKPEGINCHTRIRLACATVPSSSHRSELGRKAV
jgi:hypothetical protein